MAFVEKFVVNSLEGIPPVKAYLHECNVHAYGSNPLTESKKYLEKCLKMGGEKQQESDVILAAIWAEDGKRMIDFSGLSGIADNWEANPGVSGWKFENGLYVGNPKELWCGDVSIIFGREEELRRRKRDLSEYLGAWPEMDDLSVKIDDIPEIIALRDAEKDEREVKKWREIKDQSIECELIFKYEKRMKGERRNTAYKFIGDLSMRGILVRTIDDSGSIREEGEITNVIYKFTTTSPIPEKTAEDIFAHAQYKGKGIKLRCGSTEIES